MQDLPHHYAVTADGKSDTNVTLSSRGLEDLDTAGPPEFGGPGDVWSPETLLVGAVANCFILSFRAGARAARLEWASLSCSVVGTLDKVDRITQFTAFDITAKLVVPAGTNDEKALQLMEKAKKYCLVTNSMKAATTLQASVVVSD
ncbi:MAG: OsmC family protein [Woeseiaceae bacterium]|nr:OsmC family protein [Woeseiaceae bacterium]